LQLAVHVPAPVARLPGSEPGACVADPCSPWSPPLAPPTPQLVPQPCSQASSLLRRSLTSPVRSSSATAPRLPDADLSILGQARLEISRFPNKERTHMPGSTTTPGHLGARDCALRRFAFRYTDSVGTRNQFSIVAQWLACTYPCRRFADILADACARLGADVVRYSFIAVDLHHLLLAGLPAHPCQNSKSLGFRGSLYPSRDAARPI
jgi:hypothetical protein